MKKKVIAALAAAIAVVSFNFNSSAQVTNQSDASDSTTFKGVIKLDVRE